MKKEKLAEEHCPYCKRHCSLKAPHCGKGKALAEKKLKEKIPSAKKPVTNPETEEWKNIRYEIGLARLYQKGGKLVSGSKAVRFSILAVLAKKGDMTQKELKERFGLHSRELEKALQKLEKKGCVIQKPAEGRVSLSGKGLESANEYIRDWKRKHKGIFPRLTEEEKVLLEHILKKIVE